MTKLISIKFTDADDYRTTPKRWCLGILLLVAASFCLALIYTHNIASPKEMGLSYSIFETTLLACGAIIFLFLACFVIRGKLMFIEIKEHREKRYIRKNMKRMKKIGKYNEEFNQKIMKIYEDVFGNCLSYTDDYYYSYIAINYEDIIKTLSYEQFKTPTPYFHSIHNYVSVPAEEKKNREKYLIELQNVISIWKSQLDITGAVLARSEQRLTEADKIKWQKFGEEQGIKTAIELYYDGVPIEDIIA